MLQQHHKQLLQLVCVFGGKWRVRANKYTLDDGLDVRAAAVLNQSGKLLVSEKNIIIITIYILLLLFNFIFIFLNIIVYFINYKCITCASFF